MNKDEKRIRELALQWEKLATSIEMKQKKDAWTHLHDLNPNRPVCIIETELMTDFIKNDELQCETPWIRDIERQLLHGIKHVNLLDDDYPLENKFKTDLIVDVENYDYGVGLQYVQKSEAIMPNCPIQDSSDLDNLKERRFHVNEEASLKRKQELENLFDGTLPVQLQYSDFNLPQISKYVFDLIGMENIYFWMLDEPESIQRVVNFVKNDYLSRMKSVEESGLLSLNDNSQYAGSGSKGYISNLKQTEGDKVFLKDMWVWIESQETETISPEMFEEFFLPALQECASKFHYVYYGCCEHLHDRFPIIEKHIPNIRCVSVSPWSDRKIMGKLLGDRYVYSAKLTPSFISQTSADVAAQEKELESIHNALKNKKLVEYIYRDVYRFNNDPKKFQDWIQRVKQYM